MEEKRVERDKMLQSVPAPLTAITVGQIWKKGEERDKMRKETGLEKVGLGN